MNKCEITSDLIAAYIDEIISPSGKEYVEEHIAECKECADMLSKTKLILTENKKTEISQNISAKKPFKKIKIFKWVILCIPALIALAMIIYSCLAGYMLINKEYYKLNALFGINTRNAFFEYGMDIYKDKILELTGENGQKLTDLSNDCCYSSSNRIKASKIYTDGTNAYLVVSAGEVTGVNEFIVSEFYISKISGNEYAYAILSSNEFYVAKYNEETDMYECDMISGHSIDILKADKENYINNAYNNYISYDYETELAMSAAEQDWENEYTRAEIDIKYHTEYLKNKYNVSDSVIEEWVS